MTYDRRKYIGKRGLVTITFIYLSQSLLSQEPAKDSTNRQWSFSASGYYYFIPHDKDQFSAIAYADHKKLHLETRYNYENQNTASEFAGWIIEKPGKLHLTATPMLGLMFGRSNGFIPGLELDLGYKRFNFYSETEYVIDFSRKENNYLYVWGEITFNPVSQLLIGVSYQKTGLYQTDFDIQRGAVIKYFVWKLTPGLYYFNPFSSTELFIVSLSFDF